MGNYRSVFEYKTSKRCLSCFYVDRGLEAVKLMKKISRFTRPPKPGRSSSTKFVKTRVSSVLLWWIEPVVNDAQVFLTSLGYDIIPGSAECDIIITNSTHGAKCEMPIGCHTDNIAYRTDSKSVTITIYFGDFEGGLVTYYEKEKLDVRDPDGPSVSFDPISADGQYLLTVSSSDIYHTMPENENGICYIAIINFQLANK